MWDFPKIPDLSTLTREKLKIRYEEDKKFLNEWIEIEHKRVYHPELLNGWINREGDFLKIDNLDHHELWGMEYLSNILGIGKYEVQKYIREKFKTNLLDYFSKLGWIKITQWKEEQMPSAVHSKPMNEMQEIRIEKIKQMYKKELEIIYITFK